VLVLAATQAPLAQSVESGQLRNDLVARLGVITVRLPALEERREDIPPLFRFFVQEEAGARRTLDPELIEWLCLQRFPQNVRELEWLARAVVAMHEDAPTLGLEHLPAQYRQSSPSATSSSVQKASRLPPPMSSAPSTSVAESVPDDDNTLFQQLVRALDENNGVVLRAADALGITRQKAYRMLSKHPNFELETLRKKR
jgi:DNA-binding NtrC family response regulator